MFALFRAQKNLPLGGGGKTAAANDVNGVTAAAVFFHHGVNVTGIKIFVHKGQGQVSSKVMTKPLHAVWQNAVDGNE